MKSNHEENTIIPQSRLTDRLGSMADKVWVFIDVLPRNVTDIDRESENIRHTNGGIEDACLHQSGHHTIFPVKCECPGLAFEVSTEQLLFFFGEALQPGHDFTTRKVVSIVSPRPSKGTRKELANDDSKRHEEHCTEIRLTVFPKLHEPEWFKGFFASKKDDARSNGKWSRKVRDFFQQFANRGEPFHVQKPNVK